MWINRLIDLSHLIKQNQNNKRTILSPFPLHAPHRHRWQQIGLALADPRRRRVKRGAIKIECCHCKSYRGYHIISSHQRKLPPRKLPYVALCSTDYRELVLCPCHVLRLGDQYRKRLTIFIESSQKINKSCT